jgi:para-aminobenzoate synthetase component 1
MNYLTLPYCSDTLLLFERLRDLPHPVLLHSSDRSSSSGRYDILAADPARTVSFDAGVLIVGGHRAASSRPLNSLRDFFTKHNAEPFEHFRSGFIGCFGYGLQHTLERLPPSPRDVTGMPALFGGDYRWALVTDSKLETTRLWYDSDVPAAYASGIVRKLTSPASTPRAEFSIGAGFTPTTTDASYRDAFEAIKRYIDEGDCYQVNLARHYATSLGGDRANASWSAYRRLVEFHPGPVRRVSVDTPRRRRKRLAGAFRPVGQWADGNIADQGDRSA